MVFVRWANQFSDMKSSSANNAADLFQQCESHRFQSRRDRLNISLELPGDVDDVFGETLRNKVEVVLGVDGVVNVGSGWN